LVIIKLRNKIKGGNYMPLPQENSEWLPKYWKCIYNKYAEWAAWYSSDVESIINLYTDHLNQPYLPGNKMRQTHLRKEIQTYLFVPVAADISSTSANLLFSEQPIIRIAEAHQDNPSASATATQDRLDKILADGDFYSKILEAAESASALGGCFLKPNWDVEFKDIPIIDVIQADHSIPTFKWGFLNDVYFFKEVYEDDKNVWRLIELHTKGQVQNVLYRGSYDNIGFIVPLTSLSCTADLQDIIQTGIDDLMVRYIANIKPNKKYRGSGLGNSDYQGNEGLFDSINQTYTSWIKEIKLGQARIIIPESWLERQNGEFTFNADREIFTALDIDPLSAKGEGINQVQFNLRVTEHKDTVNQLVMQAITDSGYSPQSFGMNISGQAESGTALNLRERKSLVTTGKKQIFFRQALQDLLEMLLDIDQRVFRTPGIEVIKPTIEFQDSLSFDMGEVSTTVETLNRAQAISVRTKVQMVHPDWTKQQIDAEVDTVLQETGIGPANIDNIPG
jgi:A118 family predicted phage portal protein